MRMLSQPCDFSGHDSSDENSDDNEGSIDITTLPVSEWPLPPKVSMANHFLLVPFQFCFRVQHGQSF